MLAVAAVSDIEMIWQEFFLHKSIYVSSFLAIEVGFVIQNLRNSGVAFRYVGPGLEASPNLIPDPKKGLQAATKNEVAYDA